MRLQGLHRATLIILTAAGIVATLPSLAARAADPAPQVTDVALGDGGMLLGQVLDRQGVVKKGVPVALRAGEETKALAKTDENGRFAFSEVPGGVYQLATTDGQGIYRAWAPGTAPPSAKPGVLLVCGGSTVLSQYGGEVVDFLSQPIVIAGAVTAAVAVPIIVIKSRHPASP